MKTHRVPENETTVQNANQNQTHQQQQQQQANNH